MSVTIVKERYSGKIGEVILGATSEQGGTRTSTVTIGGDSTLPYLHFEGKVSRPVIAMEVNDIAPVWNATLTKQYGDVFNNPGAWAKQCVDEFGADLIYLKLIGADPDAENRSPEDCVRVVKEVLAAVGVPLIVVGCGDTAKEMKLLQQLLKQQLARIFLLVLLNRKLTKLMQLPQWFINTH